MKKLLKQFRHGQRGFTLIELLIVVAILGIIAAVAVPNVGAFMGSADLNAANTEVQNVKTAALAYYADQSPPKWPTTVSEASGELKDYLTGIIKGSYTFGTNGLIDTASYGEGETALYWDAPHQKFLKAAPTT